MAYKEFHGGGEYAKGKGREFIAWLKKHHPDAFFLPFENAHGTRMDMSFDGMVPIFANRKLMAEFLNQLGEHCGAPTFLPSPSLSLSLAPIPSLTHVSHRCSQ